MANVDKAPPSPCALQKLCWFLSLYLNQVTRSSLLILPRPRRIRQGLADSNAEFGVAGSDEESPLGAPLVALARRVEWQLLAQVRPSAAHSQSLTCTVTDMFDA